MLSILSDRNFMVESTYLQGKELELLLWVHFGVIVLVVAHLELLSSLSVWGEGETSGNRRGGGGPVGCEIGGGPGGRGCGCSAKAVLERGSKPSVGGGEPSSPPADPAMSITKKNKTGDCSEASL